MTSNSVKISPINCHLEAQYLLLKLFSMLMVTLGLLGITLQVNAQNYPSRSVRIVVAQAPGSSVDVFARVLSSKLTESWKTSVIVENKQGANGNIGMDLIAKSSPDGYTFGIAVPSVMVINPFVYKNLPFKAMEDLAPISQTTSITFALVTNPKLPVRNVQELIQYAKKSAVELNYSSAGVGNLQHLAAELLSLKTAIKLNHIPNKGDTPAMTDVMAGNTDFMFVPLPSAINHIKSGKLKLIAVASKKRVIQFPDVPTLSEDGLPDLIIEGWLGLVAPTGTPTQIIEEIQKMTAQIILEPTVKKGIEAQGFEVVASSPKEFKEFLLQESAKWSSVIQKSNIKLGD